MKIALSKLAPGGSGLRWLQWVAILLAVGLFSVLGLIVTALYPVPDALEGRMRPLTPGSQHAFSNPMHAVFWINGIAGVLAAVIAPYLLRSFEGMQRRSEQQFHELRSLHTIDRAINAQQDLKTLLEIALKEATLAMDAEVGALYLWREGRVGQAEERAVYGISPAMLTLLGDLLDERAQVLAKASGPGRRLAGLDATWQTDRLNSSLKLRSLIAVPVQYQDRTLGLFLLGNRGGALGVGEGFSDEDERLLHDIAGTVAIAIQNARFVQETRRRGEMLRALIAHTGEALAASSDAARLMQLFVGAAARILGCPRVAVYAHAPDGGEFLPLAAMDQSTDHGTSWVERFHDRPLPAGPVLRVLRADGRPDTEPRDLARLGEALAEAGTPAEFPARGAAFVLRAHDRRVLGLLCLGDLPAGREVAEFAQALAAQATVTLENARLFAELERLYEREKHIAGELQNTLLPAIPALVGDFEFAHVYQPALEEAQVGGDFLDHFPLEGARVGFVMADVSGKGLNAAVQTAMVKYTLRAFAHEFPDEPARVLYRVNNAVSSRMNAIQGFVTLFYGVLDTETGELLYATAGHEPPLLRRAADGAIVPLAGSDGMVLGCLPDVSFEECSLALAPEDFLLLYTDGVTESRDVAGQEFLGLDGLCHLLPAAGRPAREAISRLYQDLQAFAGNVRRDDIAMLLVRRAPAAPQPAD